MLPTVLNFTGFISQTWDVARATRISCYFVTNLVRLAKLTTWQLHVVRFIRPRMIDSWRTRWIIPWRLINLLRCLRDSAVKTYNIFDLLTLRSIPSRLTENWKAYDKWKVRDTCLMKFQNVSYNTRAVCAWKLPTAAIARSEIADETVIDPNEFWRVNQFHSTFCAHFSMY